MIKKRLALSIFVAVILIFMVGLSGCDMGSNTIAEIEEVERVEGSRVEATASVIPYSISGIKFDVTDEGMVALEGWKIELYESNIGEEKLDKLGFKETDSDGFYKFTEDLEEGFYIVREVLKDGWEQVSPTNPDYYFIELTNDNRNSENNIFENRRIDDDPLYSISGRKLDHDGEKGLDSWTIELYRPGEDDPMLTALTETVDDVKGYYEFINLEAGEYIVKEVLKDSWEQVYPNKLEYFDGETFYHVITLPVPNSENVNAVEINFINKKIIEERVCFDETIWAADEIDGEKVTRFVDRGNWATYIEYELEAGSEDVPKVYTLYADQDHKAGTLEVYDDAGEIFVRYLIGSDQDNNYKDGYCGSWSYLTEYHLHVVNEFDDFSSVRNRPGNPIPGRFEYSGIYELEDEKNDTGWITIKGDFDGTVYIAAHGVAQWCGYLCEIE